MVKTIYLLRGSKAESYTDFSKRIKSIAESMLSLDEISQLKLVLTENRPPSISIIPFKKDKIAAISMVAKTSDLDLKIQVDSGFIGTYHVTEALPVAYTKTWHDGQVSPGVCLLTLFKKKKSIDYPTFIDRWHNGHTPLSLELHPLWNYNRNVVESHSEHTSEFWDGIVEEHCKTRGDLLNPFKFFGRPTSIIQNMISVYKDTKSFLDYGSIEPYLAMEYWLKSSNTQH